MEEGATEKAAADAAMDRYAAGDDEAFEQVFELLGPRLYTYLCRQVREKARAEDLVQDTFVQIHRGRSSFMSGAEVLPWAFAIARRLLIDSIRRTKRQVPLVDAEDERSSHCPSPGASADRLIEASELAKRMQAVLDGLPPAQRVAFELVKLDGFSLADAAQVLETTVPAVKLRTHRAYEALRAVLGADYEVGKGGRLP